MELKPTFECFSCILRQVVESCEYANCDRSKQYQALKSVIQYLNEINIDDIDLVKLGSDLHRIVRKVTGNPDPYRDLKEESNRIALEWLSQLKSMQNHLPFMTAVWFAAVGNMIDYGAVETTVTPQSLISKALEEKLDQEIIERAKHLVEKSKKILYLCDNAGEIAFDKLLVSAIQTLGSEVIVAVRGGPIINDATIEDAKMVEMTKLTRTITTGTDICGIYLDNSSSEFVNTFSEADLIISKGQGNLESLINIKRKSPTIYILKVKCKIIADYLKTDIGSNKVVIDPAH